MTIDIHSLHKIENSFSFRSQGLWLEPLMLQSIPDTIPFCPVPPSLLPWHIFMHPATVTDHITRHFYPPPHCHGTFWHILLGITQFFIPLPHSCHRLGLVGADPFRFTPLLHTTHNLHILCFVSGSLYWQRLEFVVQTMHNFESGFL